MKTILALAFSALLVGCATAHLSDRARLVRLQQVRPGPECKYLGEVTGSDRGRSVSGIVWERGDSGSMAAARIDLKNEAAEIGANTVEMTLIGSGYITGEGYRCAE